MIGNPIAFRVLIRPTPVIKEKEITTDSGLVLKLALSVDERMEAGATDTGTIVALGPDVYAAFKTSLKYGGLKVGQKVAFAKYSGKWVEDPQTKENLLVVNDEDIVLEFTGEPVNDSDSNVATQVS